MVSKAFSMGLFGMHAFKVEVECDLSAGLPAFDLVGLPDAAVKESRNRVRAALKNCGFDFPVSRITMNLAPADVRKEGPVYDLPLLIALLKATGQLNVNTDDCIFAGELSLSGALHPVRGVLSMAIEAGKLGYTRMFVPAENAYEAAVVTGLSVYPVHTHRPSARYKADPARRAVPQRSEKSAAAAGLRRCKRAGTGKARFRDCRKRRAQRVTHRLARFRQKHACKAPAVHSAANVL